MGNTPPRRVYALTLRQVHTFMLARGFTTEQLLANTELRKSDIQDPYRLISEEQARQFYRNVVRLAESPGIGLEIGWVTPLTDKGPLGLMQIASRNVRDSLRNAWQTRYTYNLLLDWDIEIAEGIVINRFSSEEEDEGLRTFLVERALGLMQAHVEELLDSEARPIKVLLDYQAPVNFRRYKELFRCPIYFGQKVVEMHYPASYLDIDIQSHDPQAHEVLGALQESLQKKLATRSDIVNEVKMALRRKPGEFPGLEQVADRLAMSSRTLRRKLGQHDLRFQDLLDEERRRVAEDYLEHSTLTIQQIAEQCGFNDPQNFSQAFKRWCGLSPTEYRNSRKA